MKTRSTMTPESDSQLAVRLDDLVLQRCIIVKKRTLLDTLSQQLISSQFAHAIRSIFSTTIVSLRLEVLDKKGNVVIDLSSRRWINKIYPQYDDDTRKLVPKEQFATYLFHIFSRFTHFRKLDINFENDSLLMSDILSNFLDENNMFPAVERLALLTQAFKTANSFEANKLLIEKFSQKLKKLRFSRKLTKTEDQIKDFFSTISKCVELKKFEVRIFGYDEQLITCIMASLRDCLKSLFKLRVFNGRMADENRRFEADWLSDAFQNCVQLHTLESDGNPLAELQLLCEPSMRTILSRLRKVSLGNFNAFLMPCNVFFGSTIPSDTIDEAAFTRQLNYALQNVNEDSTLTVRVLPSSDNVAPSPEAMEKFVAWIKQINQSKKAVQLSVVIMIYGDKEKSDITGMIESWLEMCDQTTKQITVEFTYSHSMEAFHTVLFDAADAYFSPSRRFSSDCTIATELIQSYRKRWKMDSLDESMPEEYRAIRFKSHATLIFSAF